VRGQVLADLAGEDTRLSFRGDVTGLSPRGSRRDEDKLDANLALLIDPLHLTVEGRAELVHISRALLLDLIAVWDPYQADVSANRARLALKLGYPEQVRLAFEQGFASLKLRLGGLTRAVRIDEIKGVPIGPLLERYLAHTLRPLIGEEDRTAPDKEPAS
jgi:translocation and assembly module TamB